MISRTAEILDALYAELQANHPWGSAWYVADDLTDIARPYGVIDEIDVRDDSTLTILGADHRFTLHYYADTKRAALVAMAATVGQLARQELTLSAGTNWCAGHDGETGYAEGGPEARYYHGIQHWRYRTVS